MLQVWLLNERIERETPPHGLSSDGVPDDRIATIDFNNSG
jgi:hypothetical protein